jgi:membrane protein YdbS with pleckstrin-like domain
VKLPWRRGEQGSSPESGDSGLPPPWPSPYREPGPARATVKEPEESELVERSPSLLRRVGASLAETRRRVLPLPDEVIDQYLGHGERMIHNDHPSFRNFMVENTLLFVGLLVAGVLFLAITFNGSLAGAAVLLLILSIVLLVLVLKRLGDRYTSYVVTDTRIMRISGIVSRRAHSIPWVRVTDLTIEQSLAGRFFGYATLHIESANEDSGLRDLDGVSDPLQFNQYVVDMVVAKQGATAPVWEQRGEPAPIASERGLRRVRSSRRRRGSGDDRAPSGGRPAATTTTTAGTGAPTGAGGTTVVPEKKTPAAPPSRRRVSVSGSARAPQVTYGEPAGADDDPDEIDPEALARDLRAAQGPDLPWRK